MPTCLGEMSTTTGYLHPGYARSFRGSGEPLRLERAGGWLLRRRIGSGPHFDLAGAYPLFLCRDLSRVPQDLERLDRERLASAVFVTDPFCEGSIEDALSGFDLVRPFKTHHVVRLEQPWRSFASRRCRRYARKARRTLAVRAVGDPASRAPIFWELYRELLDRLRATSIRRLSRATVTAHLQLPGITLFEVTHSSRPLGFGSFFEVGDRAYAHLMGMSQEGRELLATYALYGAALDYYQGRVKWVDFGGNAGVTDDPEDGLSRFKSGWAQETRIAYLCGKVLNHRLYDSLCAAAGCGGSSYFPAYRAVER